MQRIDVSNASATPPTIAALGTPGYFVNGNAATGTPGTYVDADWLNGIQEELVAILTAAGITPSKTVRNQVLTSLQQIFRVKLTSNLTLYVSASGNDSNNGLTSGTPFATIQRAITVLQSFYDLAGLYTATIKVADGYTGVGGNSGAPFIGAIGPSSVTILGNTATPDSSVITAAANGSCFGAIGGAQFTVEGFKLTSSGNNASGLYAGYGGTIWFNALDFSTFSGSGTSQHILADTGGSIGIAGAYTISGNAISHYNSAGRISASTTVVVTLSGTPAFTNFAQAQLNGTIVLGSYDLTFSGSATGVRYIAIQSGVISTNGSGATYFPGSTAGSASAGQYS